MPPASLPTAADVAARTLYLYSNRGPAGLGAGGALDADDVISRSLYLYVNRGAGKLPSGGVFDGEAVLSRVLYLYVNRGHGQEPADLDVRALYLFENYTNDEPFPWIERISPTEQYPGGQVNVYGDGFGATDAAEGGSVRLGVYDPDVPGPGLLLGVVTWSARSPNLWPANGDGSGANPPRTLPAIVVTVPPEAVSGMLSVEETI